MWPLSGKNTTNIENYTEMEVSHACYFKISLLLAKRRPKHVVDGR